MVSDRRASAAPLLLLLPILGWAACRLSEFAFLTARGGASLRGAGSSAGTGAVARPAGRGGRGEYDSGEFDFGEFNAPASGSAGEVSGGTSISVFDLDEVEETDLAPPEAEIFMERSTGKYVCGSCGEIYDPFWNQEKFEDLPSNWRCPGCKVSKDKYTPQMETVAGFVENQDYGLGVNGWTSQQKNVAIWGGLTACILFLLGFYFVE
mmetsp:Transcript_95954/g.311205  ORF Transcript_95954/g.311205 Transcript_95954/m.311205 type:complete len:208 (+) Transcript_95954:137-760(+)